MSRRLRDLAERHFQNTISLIKKDKNKEALQELEKAEEAAEKANAKEILQKIMSIKGELLLETGEFDKSLEAFEFSSNFYKDDLLKVYKDEFLLASLQRNLDGFCSLGNIYSDKSNFIKATKCYEIGLEISQNMFGIYNEEEFFLVHIADSLNNLGALFIDVGKKRKQEKNLKNH